MVLTLIITELLETTGNQIYRTARYMDKRTLKLVGNQPNTIMMRIRSASTSFPKERPDATASASPTALISNVHGVRNASRT